MSSVNKVILLGRLGRDPEIRYMPDGKPVASFGLATTEQWKDKNGERQSRTEWHQIELYGRLADVAGQYLKKGSQVYLEGKIKTNESEENGVKRKFFKIVCSTMTMLGSSNNDSQSSGPTPAPPGRNHDTAPTVTDLTDEDIPY
jgi:single-strand DNA-binding protein